MEEEKKEKPVPWGTRDKKASMRIEQDIREKNKEKD